MPGDARPTTGVWVAACATAETIGLATSAAAARAADSLTSRPEWWGGAATALVVVVAAGLVEGSALGWFQGTVLRRRLPGLELGHFVVATVLVAGLGWAVASAPAVLASGGAGAAPPLPLVLLGAAGIGLLMGPVLGGAQALVLRGRAARPGRWVLANTLAWPPAMVVIYLGATRPDAAWPMAAVVALGAATGAAAGVVVGAVTSGFLPVPRRPDQPAPDEEAVVGGPAVTAAGESEG